jgi:threonine synthase
MGVNMNNLLNRQDNLGANLYIDTRNNCSEPVSFTRAVVNGLAPGGGLYIPQEIPSLSLDEICNLANMPYWQRAATIYKSFNIDLSDKQIDVLMQKTYGDNFDTPDICPITSLDNNVHMLELWHGPTSAFKDMALQCLPNFFAASAAKLREQGELDHEFCILVATSGDTGKAALEGFKGVEGVSVGVLYPDGGVSDIQRAQMETTTGDNVYVWAVRGNFDNCQTAVKQIFADADFEKKLNDSCNIELSSANSINWGRLLPQIVYYISAYACLVRDGKIKKGSNIDICVPTGNFGNILAAWYARQIGTPIEKLICASNENCVLTDFLKTGTYDINDREFKLTPSPSMDILVSSNLERQLYELTNRDGDIINVWMKDLKEVKRFDVDDNTLTKIQEVFSAYSSQNDDCLATIKTVFEKEGYLLDPHSAVAYNAALACAGSNPIVVAATAHWAKFGINVYRALHKLSTTDSLPEEISKLSGCDLNRLIAKETGCHNIPSNLDNLDKMTTRFNTVVDSDIASIESAVLQFLS